MGEIALDDVNSKVEKDYGTNCLNCERYKRVGEVCVLEHGKRFLWEYCRDFEPKVELPDYNELMRSVRQEHALQRKKERERKEREKKLKIKEREARKEQKRRERIARARRKYFARLKKEERRKKQKEDVSEEGKKTVPSKPTKIRTKRTADNSSNPEFKTSKIAETRATTAKKAEDMIASKNTSLRQSQSPANKRRRKNSRIKAGVDQVSGTVVARPDNKEHVTPKARKRAINPKEAKHKNIQQNPAIIDSKQRAPTPLERVDSKPKRKKVVANGNVGGNDHHIPSEVGKEGGGALN
ncbi:MAG TPA: hypothetical protein VFF30_15710 [Nitrososphaerales archaeon]|nr:hypothetical protein [Nitrososphaerales archaeon]